MNNKTVSSDIEDVLPNRSGIGMSMEKNEVIGSDTNVLQGC